MCSESGVLTRAQCNESYTEENIIPILPPNDTDKQRLMARGQKLAEQGLTHSLKKAPGSKKRKKNANNDSPAEQDTPAESKSQAQSNGVTSRSNTSTPTPGASHGIKNAATAMLTARVLEEENDRKRRRKFMGNDNLDSLFTKERRDGKPKGSDFMTRGYTIPAADGRK